MLEIPQALRGKAGMSQVIESLETLLAEPLRHMELRDTLRSMRYVTAQLSTSS